MKIKVFWSYNDSSPSNQSRQEIGDQWSYNHHQALYNRNGAEDIETEKYVMIKSRSKFHQVKTYGPCEESDRNQERERGDVIGQDKHCNPIIAIKLFSIKNLLYIKEQGVKTTN
jgi:hypothetical protein